MEEQENKKRCLRSFVGKGHRHLVTAVCDDKQMTVVVASAKGVTTYFLHRQDEDYHHHLQ